MALSATGIIEKALKTGELECGDKEVTIRSGDFKITVKEDDKKHEGYDRVIITDNNGKTLHNLTWKRLNKTLFNELSAFIEKNKETDCRVPMDARVVAVGLGEKPRARVKPIEPDPAKVQETKDKRTEVARIRIELDTLRTQVEDYRRLIGIMASTDSAGGLSANSADLLTDLRSLKGRAQELKIPSLAMEVEGLISTVKFAEGQLRSMESQQLAYDPLGGYFRN